MVGSGLGFAWAVALSKVITGDTKANIYQQDSLPTNQL